MQGAHHTVEESPTGAADEVVVADAETQEPASSRTAGPVVPRDTEPTAFTAILDAFIQRIHGALAAALVDSQGETVDYAGRGEPFDLRVSAAHVQIVLASVARFGAFGEPRWVAIRGERKSLAATVLPDGYVLVLLLRPRAAFSISTRALEVCVRSLSEEAGWRRFDNRNGAKRRSWFEVAVETDHRGRPTRIGPSRVAVEVLGTVIGLSVRERGFRVRTAEGGELTLVREARQQWYADEPV